MGYGGGIYNDKGVMELTNSTVSGNTASNGGGIYHESGYYCEPFCSTGHLELRSTTVSGNTATYYGGGIYNTFKLSTIYSTVSDNTASNGGGIFNLFNDDVVKSTNTLVARNTATVNPDVRGPFDSQGYNLIGDITGASGWIATDLQNVDDPLLGPLQDNGGPTNTHALLPGSPAINAIPIGDINSGCTAWPPNTDQRGVARPQGAACDNRRLRASQQRTRGR